MKKIKLQDILNVIEKWIIDNDYLVEFHGSFISFKDNKEFKIKEDIMLAYGTKETLKISIEEMFKNINEEKEEFVNW